MNLGIWETRKREVAAETTKYLLGAHVTVQRLSKRVRPEECRPDRQRKFSLFAVDPQVFVIGSACATGVEGHTCSKSLVLACELTNIWSLASPKGHTMKT